VKNYLSKIVSVEDNEDHFDIMEFHLKDINPELQVLHYSDGESAIKNMAEIRSFMPQIILLDLNLPKFSGIEVLAELRQNPEFLNIPVIMFTTSNNKKDIRAAYATGANSYLLKPIEPDGIRNSLKAILEYWGSNELDLLEPLE
jgi:CheY-like chemotaxis protein